MLRIEERKLQGRAELDRDRLAGPSFDVELGRQTDRSNSVAPDPPWRSRDPRLRCAMKLSKRGVCARLRPVRGDNYKGENG